MSEYRRFIAYFYEYIDGKKHKNAGFAKVELRNRMWRILFRFSSDICLESPVQIYGFVREQGYLLGLPMGGMRSGQRFSEEWAYQAEVPFSGKYRIEDLSGIWIQSSDGRVFLTVWDKGEIQLDRFVLKIPDGLSEEAVEEAAVTTEATEELMQAVSSETTEELMKVVSSENSVNLKQAVSSETTGKITQVNSPVTTGNSVEILVADVDTEKENSADITASEIHCEESRKRGQRCRKYMEAEHLLRVKPQIKPFEDAEISPSVMIKPCDVVWLQQCGWQIGRNSFLQHGYYQYQHLLLGKYRNGKYLIGVPGINNPQEKYMAGLFGYTHFKKARQEDERGIFGYWYQIMVN